MSEHPEADTAEDLLEEVYLQPRSISYDLFHRIREFLGYEEEESSSSSDDIYYETDWKAPRIKDFPRAARKTAEMLHLTLEIEVTEKGWWFESGTLTVSGYPPFVEQFTSWFEGLEK